MVKINVICVGNLKDDFFKGAQEEYKKRLKAFCEIDIIEIKEENVGNASAAEIESALKRESVGILNRAVGFVILFDRLGKKLSSEAFSQKLQQVFNTSGSLSFIIGSSHGVAKEVKDKADMVLSFSDMTLPHRLFRVVALEQIYRAFTIMKHLPYHK